MIVMGVDPGGKETGVVIREDSKLHDHAVLTGSLTKVIGELSRIHATWQPQLVAVETVDPPQPYINGQRRIINVEGVIGTAAVYGAVVALFPGAVPVPPAGNGQAHRLTYPNSLWGPRETAGGGVLRHCRSAWDVAEAGRRLAGLLARIT